MTDIPSKINEQELLAKAQSLLEGDPDERRAWIDSLSPAEFDALHRAVHQRLGTEPEPLSAAQQALWDQACGRQH